MNSCRSFCNIFAACKRSSSVNQKRTQRWRYSVGRYSDCGENQATSKSFSIDENKGVPPPPQNPTKTPSWPPGLPRCRYPTGYWWCWLSECSNIKNAYLHPLRIRPSPHSQEPGNIQDNIYLPVWNEEWSSTPRKIYSALQSPSCHLNLENIVFIYRHNTSNQVKT